MLSQAQKANQKNERFERLDALRGLAIVWMTVFHFCFDLNYFGFLNQNFYQDNFWIFQRNLIVSMFLFCAGAGQATAVYSHLSWSRFFSRWKRILVAAVLVTIGSYIVYPNSFIYFGILHAMAVMILILRLASRWSRYYLLFGLAILGLHRLVPKIHSIWPSLDFLNKPQLNWLGIISYKPITEDYVPLVPWLGVLFIGYFLAEKILTHKREWFAGELRASFRILAVLGRWSLSYYLIHQPVLFATVMLVKKITI